jgi:hypothetical protein
MNFKRHSYMRSQPSDMNVTSAVGPDSEVLGVKLLQPLSVLQHNLPMSDFRKSENALLAKVGQSAGDSFECKTQIVRDIPPGHRQSKHACLS